LGIVKNLLHTTGSASVGTPLLRNEHECVIRL
jgi:hypothetical protein